MLLRILGVWLLTDGVGSVCLRHEDLKNYRILRKALELGFRLIRLSIGIVLVVLD